MISKTDFKESGNFALIKKKLSMGDASSMVTVIGALLALIIFFGIRSPYFFTLNNFLNIGLYAAIMGTIACGMTFINVSGCIDISVGSQVALIGMIVAIVSQSGNDSIILMIAAGIATGLVCGAFNGFFITKLKLNAFITTIASMQIFRGIAYLVTDGQSVVIPNIEFKFIGRGYIMGIPFTLIIMAVSYLVFHIISKYTVFGRTILHDLGNPRQVFSQALKYSAKFHIIHNKLINFWHCRGNDGFPGQEPASRWLLSILTCRPCLRLFSGGDSREAGYIVDPGRSICALHA